MGAGSRQTVQEWRRRAVATEKRRERRTGSDVSDLPGGQAQDQAYARMHP
jgi:hypothetical protein